jgi:hypothetical protein
MYPNSILKYIYVQQCNIYKQSSPLKAFNDTIFRLIMHLSMDIVLVFVCHLLCMFLTIYYLELNNLYIYVSISTLKISKSLCMRVRTQWSFSNLIRIDPNLIWRFKIIPKGICSNLLYIYHGGLTICRIWPLSACVQSRSTFQVC